MFAALAKAFAQLPEPVLRRSVIFSILGALVMILASGYFGWLLIAKFGVFGIGAFDELTPWIGSVVIVVGALIFFPSTVMVVAGFFLDPVATAVEVRHYPSLGAPRNQSLGEVMKSAFTLLAITVVLNAMLLPVYLITLFIPGLNFVIFYGLNGYLFGREFFEMVAGRRMEPADARVLRRANRWGVTGAGIVIAVLTTIPFLNLAAPVIATAFMVHMFHRLRQQPEA